MKTISVILTTYNGEDCVSETVDSILNQTGNGSEFDVELIAIDDCSDDDTPLILESFDCDVLRTPKNTGGPNCGRNLGLKRAAGDYICIADQDDVWHREKILSVLPFLEMAPIVSSGYKVVDTFKNRTFYRCKSSESGYEFYPRNQTFLQRLSRSKLGQNTYLGSLIFSRNMKDIYFEEDFGFVDSDWILRMFHNKSSVEVCKSLYERRVDGSNLSLNENYRKCDFELSVKTVLKYFDDYPQQAKLGYKRIFGTMARYYYLMGEMKKSRYYLKNASFNFRNSMYYLTTYAGSKFVKKHFHIFG